MGKFRLRPVHKEIDLSTLDFNQVDFICNMAIINKIIAKQRNVKWNDETQNEFDEKFKIYFLVKRNMEYTTRFGSQIDELIKSGSLTVDKVITDKGRKCIDHFIKSL